LGDDEGALLMKLAGGASKLFMGLVFLLFLTTFTFSAGLAQEQSQPVAPATAPSFDEIKTALDEAEATVDDEAVTGEKLAELRQKISDLASKLRDQLGEIEPRASEAAERLKQLGPAPPKEGPAESEDIANERKELTAEASELDGEVKQARLLLLRADQLSERVSEKRHALYARELFARTQSILDPQFWLAAGNALPVEWRRLDGLLASWQQGLGESVSRGFLIGTALSLAAIILLIYLAGRRRRPAVASSPDAAAAAPALRVFAWTAGPPALVALVAFLIARMLGLLPFRMEQIAQAMVAGIAVAAVGRGVGVSLFAPRQPERRLALLDDQPASILCGFLVWASGALALTIVVQAIHKVAFAPLVVTVATNALFAAATAALLSLLVARLGRLKTQQSVGTFAVQWVQPLALVMACVISAALVAGFAGFAAFMALRTIVAAVVFGALYLLLEATKAFFAGSGEQTARRHALAAHLGVTAQGLGLIGAMLSGAIRLVLVALSCLVIIGPWEISTADLFDTIRNVPFGFKIDDIHVSLMAVLGALVVLGVVILVTRMARRWLEHELLPRTKMEPSLQHSIATIFGYLGVIAAIALTLGNLGIDLQKIALVAGALSVGIGFGLQSIVSNFVSGLILLAERPIRVGDSIVVKGEEGWVRRVRVRATEIETFDRASVIIPNSELITGVVKNWTRANTLGRIIIKVGASYDADPEKVRDILMGIAKAHPQIVQTPAPAAYLLGFGASALEFELRCIVLNVDSTLTVKSDLHFAIMKAFKEAGIEMSSDLLSESAARQKLLENSDVHGKDQSIRRAV
jgi:small-conductance mechanosensitive channel